ncbi:hypothetical protein PQX77_017475, partial [Marasmius sp. AFHP31]
CTPKHLTINLLLRIFTGMISTLLPVPSNRSNRPKRRRVSATFCISSAPPPPLSSAPPPPLLSSPLPPAVIPVGLPVFTPLPPQLRFKRRKQVDSLPSSEVSGLIPTPSRVRAGGEGGDGEEVMKTTKKRRATGSWEVEEPRSELKSKSKSTLGEKERAPVPTLEPPRSVPQPPSLKRPSPAKAPTLVVASASSLRPRARGRTPKVLTKLNSGISSSSSSATENPKQPRSQSVVARILGAQDEVMKPVSASKGPDAVDVVTALALSAEKQDQSSSPTVAISLDGAIRSPHPKAAAAPTTTTSCRQETPATDRSKRLQPQPEYTSSTTPTRYEKEPRSSSPFSLSQLGFDGMGIENPTQLLRATDSSYIPSDTLPSRTGTVAGKDKFKPQPTAIPLQTRSPVPSPASDKSADTVSIEEGISPLSGSSLQTQDANGTIDRAFLNFEDEETSRKGRKKVVVVLSDDSDDEVEEIPRMSVKSGEADGSAVGGSGVTPLDYGAETSRSEEKGVEKGVAINVDAETGERHGEMDVDEEAIPPNQVATGENENDTYPPIKMDVDNNPGLEANETNNNPPSSPIVKPDTPSSWDLQYTPREHSHSDLIKIFYHTGKTRKLNLKPRLVCRSCVQARPTDKASWKRFNVGESVFGMLRHVEKEHEGWYERVCSVEEEIGRIVKGMEVEGM